MWRVLLVSGLMLGSAPAHADVTSKLATRVSVDWTRGLVLATAGVAGKLGAPTPGIARTEAERRARDLVRKKLDEVTRQLPWAGSMDVGKKLGDKPAALELGHRAVDINLEYASDGSTTVTLGLPIESVRLAVVGADAQPYKNGVAAIVIDARRLKLHPAIGWTVRAGSSHHAGPTLFADTMAAADKLAKQQGRVANTMAKKVDGDVVELVPGASDLLKQASESGALMIFVIGAK